MNKKVDFFADFMEGYSDANSVVRSIESPGASGDLAQEFEGNPEKASSYNIWIAGFLVSMLRILVKEIRKCHH